MGLLAFQKKREYGPSTINVNDLEMFGYIEKYLLEKKSIINLSGETLNPNCHKVVNELYGNKYGVSSH